MSAGDDEDISEKTNIFNTNTVKIKAEPNAKVPSCLVLLVGPPEMLGKQWQIDRALTVIGRSVESDIQIADTSLSKKHARIDLKDNQTTITDLGATNKTLVDGQVLEPMQPRTLKNNDQIQCGALIFKFLERGILSETAEKERMQSELETARTLQEALFPKNKQATYQWVKVGGQYRSASECGGDWWWHWTCGQRAFALIADATGHGAAAALLTSAARSAIAMVQNNASAGIDSVYSTLSHAIRNCSGGMMTMSAFIVQVDLVTRKMIYVNASHLPAALLPKDASALNWKTIRYLIGTNSAPLGTPTKKVLMTETMAPPNSRLVLLTDGLTERIDTNGEMLSERAFGQMLLKVHKASNWQQDSFLTGIMGESDRLAESAPLADDITVVAMDFE